MNDDVGSVALGELAARRNLLKQLAARRELKGEVELFLALERVVELDCERRERESGR